jgi:hypothetical protein
MEGAEAVVRVEGAEAVVRVEGAEAVVRVVETAVVIAGALICDTTRQEVRVKQRVAYSNATKCLGLKPNEVKRNNVADSKRRRGRAAYRSMKMCCLCCSSVGSQYSGSRSSSPLHAADTPPPRSDTAGELVVAPLRVSSWQTLSSKSLGSRQTRYQAIVRAGRRTGVHSPQ